MTIKIYYVHGGGDSDVGIGNIESKITIDDNGMQEDDEVQIKNTKEFLSEYYDVPINCVYTEKEWEEELKNQDEIWKKN